MNGLSFLGFLLPLAGIGVVVLFIVAVIQQSKHEQSGGFKQAFYTVVSLVMLSITIGAFIATLIPTLRQTVFTQASSYATRFDLPPTLYLAGHPGEVVKETSGNTYTCADKCDFTVDDKAQFTSWKQQYQDWQKRQISSSARFRNDLVGPLSFLIVGLPLYFVFMRLMEKGAKDERMNTSKPLPLRSLYYYFVAFSGLIMAVFAVGALLNTTLRVALKAEDPNQQFESIPAIGVDQGNGVRSIIACAEQCGFTVEDVDLANAWLSDSADFKDRSSGKTGRIQDDLANNLPLLAVGFPLFWLHFTRIRKETQVPPVSPTPIATS